MQRQHCFGFLLPLPKKIPPSHKEIQPDIKNKHDKHCTFWENSTLRTLCIRVHRALTALQPPLQTQKLSEVTQPGLGTVTGFTAPFRCRLRAGWLGKAPLALGEPARPAGGCAGRAVGPNPANTGWQPQEPEPCGVFSSILTCLLSQRSFAGR